MNSTVRGGATVRRMSGGAVAEGAWDADAVRRSLADLVRRRDELVPRFEGLAARLSDARERLDNGLPPEPRLDADLVSARGLFERLLADIRALAGALDVPLPQQSGSPALPDIAAALEAIQAGLQAELDRQARWAAARRDAALAVLGRVAQIAYRGPADAAGAETLRVWQGRARALGEAITVPAPPDLHPDVAPLCDGTHPFGHLLDLIDGLPTLDEPEYRRLVNAVAAELDEPLARAAGRGLLVSDPV
jgi:hypothetical protein